MSSGKVNLQKKELQKIITTKKKQFIDSLTILINSCYFKNKNDELMLDIKNSFAAFKNIAEDIIIKNAGDYVWKYREEIHNLNDNFFINSTFQNDINEYYVRNPKEDRFTKKDVNKVFSILKSTYPNLNDGEKKTIWTHTRNLLKFYSEYILAKKQLNSLK